MIRMRLNIHTLFKEHRKDKYNSICLNDKIRRTLMNDFIYKHNRTTEHKEQLV